MRIAIATLVTAILFVAQGTHGAVQDIVPDVETCAQCVVRVDPVARIGDSVGPGTLSGNLLDVNTDADGRFWITLAEEPILVFAGDGEFIRSVGEIGDGPGEFRDPQLTVMSDTGAIVFTEQGRAVFFDLAFQHVKTITSTGYRRLWDAVSADDDGTVLLNGVVGAAGELRLPFHRVDLSRGAPAWGSSFGPDLEDRGTRSGVNRVRHVFDAPTSTGIWVAERHRYRVSKWTTEGELVSDFIRTPDWFDDFSRGTIGGPGTAPHPWIVGLTEDSAGLVWVFSQVAAPDWADQWEGFRQPAGGAVSLRAVPSPWDLYTTVVEIVDPVQRRVVHRQRLDRYVVGVLPGPRIAVYSEPRLDPLIEILELALDRTH